MATPSGYVSLRLINCARLCAISIILGFLELAGAQQSSITTDLPVPPLQWLNITGLLNGTPPIPLKDSSIGYDESTRSLVIFGGESQTGLPQQNTYLLDLDALTWSTPNTHVPQFSARPPVRSRALGTGDFAANSRRDFLVYGGQGANNEALGDVWAYSFLNQFWVEVNVSGPAPSPRWGTFGGIDPANVADSANNVSTVFNIGGGSNNEIVFASSDLYQLVVTGTLAADLTTIQGVWKNISLSSFLPGKTDAGGALISQTQARPARIVVTGGCGSNAAPLLTNISCVDPANYVLTVSPQSSISPAQCPAPRLGPVMVPNLSGASTAFLSQSFMLLGIFDGSAWNDDGGLSKGEVAVLDVDAGTWARVLPAPDPSSGNSFPQPREGAAAFASSIALIGQNRNSASDTIVFGGRDAQGKYLNDVWLLRAYNGSVTQSGQRWSGFGNGQLESGVDADGTGVTVQYISQCAQKLDATPNGTVSPSAPTSLPVPASPVSNMPTFDTSSIHKALSPVSIAIALAAIILIRLSQPSVQVDRRARLIHLAIPVCIVAYSLGLAGFAVAFTSTKRHPVPSVLQRRDAMMSNAFLKTSHGRAGFVLFICLYAVVPVLALGLWLGQRCNRNDSQQQLEGDSAEDSQDILREKDTTGQTPRVASPSLSTPEIHSTDSSAHGKPPRTLLGLDLFPLWRGRESNDTSVNTPPVKKGFEVVNRPSRVSGMVHHPAADVMHRPKELVQSLNDLSWLERRRGVGAVADLDYAVNQLGRSPRSASPLPTSRPPTVTMSTKAFVRTSTPPLLSPEYLNPCDVFLHILFHAFLLSICVLTLVELFFRAPISAFVIFLVWTLAFYTCLFYLAWRGHPRASILTVALDRLRRSPPNVTPAPQDDTPIVEGGSQDFQPSGSSPYTYHQHPWRRTISPDEDLVTRTSHGRAATDIDDTEDDDNEDEDTRQRRMEAELERRDVHIVTVPKRRLWITNPS
ncbi:hypothetical protein BU17DRAFT_79994 [Hysterangium stoloniferum]|nr:hypothetical protein BU17DRAFT_79994 [Hysterangium stoloniferum]